MDRRLLGCIVGLLPALAIAANVVADYPGEIGAGSGWKAVAGEKEGKVVYVPFEGFYASKGGRFESPRFALGKKPGENAWFRLTFSAKSEADGFWWVDFFDGDGANVNDVNSRLYASEEWRDYEVMVPDMPSAETATIAFVARKGVSVRDVRMSRATPQEVAEWCDREYARLPQLNLSAIDAQGDRLPRTRKTLREGGALRVVFLGDSIVNDTLCGNAAALIARAFPNVEFTFIPSIRGCTGCWYYHEEGHFEQYVARHRPDLVVIGGISNTYKLKDADYSFAQAEDDMAETVLRCKAIGAEVVVCTPPPSYEFREGAWACPLNRSRYLAEARAPYWLQSGYIRRAAARTGVALWDMTTAPCEAISRSGKPLNWFKRDIAHNDDRGKQLIARTLAAYFAAVRDLKGDD